MVHEHYEFKQQYEGAEWRCCSSGFSVGQDTQGTVSGRQNKQCSQESMMKQVRMTRINKVISVGALALCAFVSGCSTHSPNLTQYDATMSAPLAEGQARVCFVRQSSMLGAMISHYVFDCGANIKCDSTLMEKSQVRIRAIGPSINKSQVYLSLIHI